MSSSKFDLSVVSSDPLASLEVVDAHYDIRAHGSGRISARLPPGLYITRSKSADQTHERTVRVIDQAVHVKFDSPSAFISGVMAEQRTGSALNQAMLLSRFPEADAWVAVALKGSSRMAAAFPAEVFTIRSLAATDAPDLPLRNLSPSEAAVDQAPPEYRVFTLDVDPGWYALSMPMHDGSRACLPLWISGRTSPTILIEAVRSNSSDPILDIDRLLVTYDDRETLGLEDSDRLRAVEMARRSLELGRNELTARLMSLLLMQKQQDPMLGMFALQLLLMESKKKAPVFAQVMHNMTSRLGEDHSDLVIMRAEARKRGWGGLPEMAGDDTPLVAPPLLRASWTQMVALKGRSKEVVQHGLLREVGASLLRAGVWVMWKESVIKRDSYMSAYESMIAFRGNKAALKQVSILSAASGSTTHPSRSTDALLDQTIDLVRTDEMFRTNLLGALQTEHPYGTVLDRTLARTILQIAAAEPDVSHNVRKGLSSRMAKSMDLPLPLLNDSISKLRSLF